LKDTSLDICQSTTDYTVIIKERWLKDGQKINKAEAEKDGSEERVRREMMWK